MQGDFDAEVRRTIRDEQRAVYTHVFARVEEVDAEEYRVKVSLKDDENTKLDNEDKWIPVGTPYAGNGYGERYPINTDMEGLLMVLKDPLGEMLSSRGFTYVSKQRQHSLQDVVFFPQIFFESDEMPTPNGASGPSAERYLMFHESGTYFTIHGDGLYEVVHQDGHILSIGTDEIRMSYQRDDGDLVTISATQTDISASAPDTFHPNAPGVRSRFEVNEKGQTIADGRARLGDTNAQRVDTASENTDSEDPRTYEPNGTPVSPMFLPTGTVQNPNTVHFEGAASMQFYELRHWMPERRQAEPDVSVTDPTDPAYIPVPESYRSNGTLPMGYLYINMQTNQLMVVNAQGSPKELLAL